MKKIEVGTNSCLVQPAAAADAANYAARRSARVGPMTVWTMEELIARAISGELWSMQMLKHSVSPKGPAVMISTTGSLS